MQYCIFILKVGDIINSTSLIRIGYDTILESKFRSNSSYNTKTGYKLILFLIEMRFLTCESYILKKDSNPF